MGRLTPNAHFPTHAEPVHGNLLLSREKVLGSGAKLNEGVGVAQPGLSFWPGKFTSVEFFLDTFDPGNFLGTLNCNNIFRVENYTASTLDTGFYGGTGNGCNGEVIVARISPVTGDLYVGGSFTEAGGFPYSQKLGVFRASGGWNGSIIFSAWDIVTGLAFDSTGELLTVSGPTSGTTRLWSVNIAGNTVSVSDDDAVVHLDHGNFNQYGTVTDN